MRLVRVVVVSVTADRGVVQCSVERREQSAPPFLRLRRVFRGAASQEQRNNNTVYGGYACTTHMGV